MIRDVCNILVWNHDHIQEFGGDSKSIFVLGHSTGFHLVLAALMREFIKKESDVNDIIPLKKRQAVISSIVHMIGISGIFDLWGLVKTLEQSGRISKGKYVI